MGIWNYCRVRGPDSPQSWSTAAILDHRHVSVRVLKEATAEELTDETAFCMQEIEDDR